MKKGEIEDDIVDEHLLLVFVDWCSKRCRRTRRGHEIPGTLIGAVSALPHALESAAERGAMPVSNQEARLLSASDTEGARGEG